MKNKKIGAAIENLLNELKKAHKNGEDVTLVMAVGDDEKINTTFVGTIMNASNLLANFIDEDAEFRMALGLAKILVGAKDKLKEMGGKDMDEVMEAMASKVSNGAKTDC